MTKYPKLCGKDQPCQNFQVAEESCDHSGDPQPYCCPDCGKLRYFCKNCSKDHHENGWSICHSPKLSPEFS